MSERKHKKKKPIIFSTEQALGVVSKKVPDLKDEDGSICRSWLPVVFDREPEFEDPYILEKMIPEIPAILQFIVDAMQGIEGPTDFPTCADDAVLLERKR